MSNAAAYVKNLIKSSREIHTVFLHCNASSFKKHDDVSVVRKWHMSPDPNDSSKPWIDIGYTYYTKFNGDIQTGRSVDIQPAAQYPYNHGTLAICLSGLNPEDFTEEQRESLNILCYALRDLYGKKLRFRGHKEVNPGRACPVFPYKEWLNLDQNGYLLDPEDEEWFTDKPNGKFNFVEKIFNKVGLKK